MTIIFSYFAYKQHFHSQRATFINFAFLLTLHSFHAIFILVFIQFVGQSYINLFDHNIKAISIFFNICKTINRDPESISNNPIKKSQNI